jgi:hypothetical protein
MRSSWCGAHRGSVRTSTPSIRCIIPGGAHTAENHVHPDFCGPHHVQKWRGAVHHSNIQNHLWPPFETFFDDQHRPSCVSHLAVILDHFSGGIHISGGPHQVILHVFACILMFSKGMAHLSSVDGQFPAVWVPLGAVWIFERNHGGAHPRSTSWTTALHSTS